MGSQDDGDWAEEKTGNAGHYAHEVWDAPRNVGEDSWVGGLWRVSCPVILGKLAIRFL